MNWATNEGARRLARDVSNHPWALITVVGIGGGVVGAAFVGPLHPLAHVLSPASFGDTDHLLVLGAVGLAIGVLTLLLGNPGDVELLVDNIHVSGSPAGVRNLRALLPVSLLGISAGSAIGPEAPLVQTTGSLAGWLARRRMLSVP